MKNERKHGNKSRSNRDGEERRFLETENIREGLGGGVVTYCWQGWPCILGAL